MSITYQGTVKITKKGEIRPTGDISIDYKGSLNADGTGYAALMGGAPNTAGTFTSSVGTGGAYGGNGGVYTLMADVQVF